MTEIEILEGNKLIAEFMGWQKTSVFGWLKPGEKDAWSERPDEYLQFDYSWNWLMPVIDKIEEYGFMVLMCRPSKSNYYINIVTGIGLRASHIIDNPSKFSNSGQNKILITFKTIVEFIKWYNKKNTNE